jgi:hypothetical protein
LSDFGFTGIACHPQEQNFEEADHKISSILPSWLLRPGRPPRAGLQISSNELSLFESELNSLIKDGKFPKSLDPTIVTSRRWTSCLSDLKCMYFSNNFNLSFYFNYILIGLEDLDLSNLTNITAATFHFALRLPSLVRLNLSNCSKVNYIYIHISCKQNQLGCLIIYSYH